LFSSNPPDKWEPESVVGIGTGYGLDDWGVSVRLPLGFRILSSPRRPDQLWGLPSLLSKRYRDLVLKV
jgi:hypothetical protein